MRSSGSLALACAAGFALVFGHRAEFALQDGGREADQ
jgi:hypothetical protein